MPSNAFTSGTMESVPESYNDTVRNKIIADIQSQHPWLSEFTLELVDIDSDTDTAYGVARLTGTARDLMVEFPVFYIGGKLEDISFFHMADKDLMLPFNKDSFEIISSNLNNAGLFSRVIAKRDLSGAMTQSMENTDIKPIRDLLKVSSFSRIAAMLPPAILKSYVKTAMGSCPSLINELGTAVKLNSYRMGYKTNLRKKRIADKKAAAVVAPKSIPSIVTPVFRSEAEAIELVDVKPVEKIIDAAYVLEGGGKLEGIEVPDTRKVLEVVAPAFELLSVSDFRAHIDEWDKTNRLSLVMTSMTHNTDFIFSKIVRASEYMNNPVVSSYDSDYPRSPIKRSVDYDSHRLDSAFFREGSSDYGSKRVVGCFPGTLDQARIINSILGASKVTRQHGWSPESKEVFPIKISSGVVGFLPVFKDYWTVTKLKTQTVKTETVDMYSVADNDSPDRTGLVKCVYSGNDLVKIVLTSRAADGLTYESRRMLGGDTNGPELITVDLLSATTFNPGTYSIIPDSDRSDTIVTLKPSDPNTRDCVVCFETTSARIVFDRPPVDTDNILIHQGAIEKVFSNFPIVRIEYRKNTSDNKYSVEVVPPAVSGKETGAKLLRTTFPTKEDMIKAFLASGFKGNILTLLKNMEDKSTKLAVAAVPTEEYASEDPQMEDLGSQIEAIMQVQQEIRNDMKLRDEAAAKQLELMNKKLAGIEEIQKTMTDQPMDAAPEETGAGMPAEQGGEALSVPPEVLNLLAEILVDPSVAGEYGLNEQDVMTIQKAFGGDPQAMQELGLDENSIQQVLTMVSAMEAQGQGEEGTSQDQGQDPGVEQGTVDPEAARADAYDAADKVVKAFLNPELMQELGVTPEDIGVVPIVLKTPGVASTLGIPGNLIDAIRSVYNTMKTELDVDNPEIDSVEGGPAGTDVNLNAANLLLNNVDDKSFKEYVRPILNTSALLDLMPKVKTSKLFYNNTEDFKKMLNVLGEIMLNLNLNAVKFRESMGTAAFDKILARTKKIYDEFGNLVISMFDLNKIQ